MPKRLEFTEQRFVLGEGYEDSQVVRKLIRRRNLQTFDVSPTIDVGDHQGNSGLGTAIFACEAITGFTNVKSVVILADNDEDPKRSFANVVKQLRALKKTGNLSRKWGIPNAPATVANGDPAVSIWMWPSPNQPGCLETVLWEVIQKRFPAEAKCVEHALKCSGANKWSIQKMHKASVRCFVSLAFRRNPSVGLGNLWNVDDTFIPLTETAFKPFSDHLASI